MFILSTTDNQPIYIQLYNQIREEILSGKLPENSKIPSVRELAAELSISKNTVEYAYSQLSAEGYIESKPRSGYYVSSLDLSFKPKIVNTDINQPSFSSKFSHNEDTIDFQQFSLASDSFPFRIWQKIYVDCIKEQRDHTVTYSDPQGEQILRIEIQKYLAKFRGVMAKPHQIVITSGLQHSLSILCLLLRDKYSACAMEDPGFLIARAAFRNHCVNIVPIPVHQDGIDIEVLQQSNCKAVYVTPSHQFPLGYIMSIATRVKLIDWAKNNDGLVIEDDYDSELRYSGKPISSLQGLTNQGNIVYLGTFSKALAPFPRVSYMVLPDKLINQYWDLFNIFPSSVPLFDQLVLQKFMEQGHWERHLRKLRTIYKNKYDLLVKSIRNNFGEKATILGSPAGLHIVLKVYDKTEKYLLEAARQHSVIIQPVSTYYANQRPEQNMVLLGFGSLSPKQIVLGVEKLNQAWFKT